MFDGVGWLLNGNMCVSLYDESLIKAIGELVGAELYLEPNIKPMDITGKLMKGLWAMVTPEGPFINSKFKM